MRKDGTVSTCKDEFHRNRSAFGPLKGRIEGFIREQTKDLRKQMRDLEQVVLMLQKKVLGAPVSEPRAQLTAAEAEYINTTR